MMHPGNRTLWNVCNMYNGNNINNKFTSPDYVYNGKEGVYHFWVYKTIIKIHITAQILTNSINPLQNPIKNGQEIYPTCITLTQGASNGIKSQSIHQSSWSTQYI